MSSLVLPQSVTHLKEVLQGKHSLSQHRSDKWPAFRKAWLLAHPTCALCGGTTHLEVHHIHSFVECPERELDLNNVITLCEADRFFNCHRLFGHLGNFQQINPAVVSDVKEWRVKLRAAKAEMEKRKHETAQSGRN